MNKNLVLWSVTVALGGLLFGMDVANISGAEQRIQNLWQLSDWLHGTAIAMALYGTIIGAGAGGAAAVIVFCDVHGADRHDRRPEFLWSL